jgi:DNA-binding transcriptional ArsR family regulator
MNGNTFKALGDKTRRQILSMLRKKDMTAGEIAQCFDMTKPSISHHLSVLKSAGLVEDVKEGQNVIYSINMTVLNELVSWLLEMRDGGTEDETTDQT